MLPKVLAERPNVPVIMITAYGDESTRRHAIAQGATGLLTKPIDFALLRQEIDAPYGTSGRLDLCQKKLLTLKSEQRGERTQ